MMIREEWGRGSVSKREQRGRGGSWEGVRMGERREGGLGRVREGEV